MKLDGFAPLLTSSPGDASTLIQHWFNPDDIVVLSGKRAIRQQDNVNVLSQCMSARELVTILGTTEGEEIFRDLSYTPQEMDVYINVGTPRRELIDPRQRVKEVDLDRVIGVIGDFDVGKKESFKSTEQIYDFLRGLPLAPTITVESGSGGVHAWWKFSEPNITVQQGKEISHRWWTFLDQRAASLFDARVDKLVDTARMMRLPGTVHWPRKMVGSPSVVQLTQVTGKTYATGDFIMTSQVAWQERLKKVHTTREYDKSLRISTDDYVTMIDGNKWQQLLATSSVEDYFTEAVSWSDVLTAARWTFTRTDSQGRAEWARPGREGEKSACVDWPESPEMMSLLSTSYDTGLLDLLDADIPLTKWRVALRLNWNDDYEAMVKWTLEHMRNA